MACFADEWVEEWMSRTGAIGAAVLSLNESADLTQQIVDSRELWYLPYQYDHLTRYEKATAHVVYSCCEKAT